jgi:hypothetical protein
MRDDRPLSLSSGDTKTVSFDRKCFEANLNTEIVVRRGAAEATDTIYPLKWSTNTTHRVRAIATTKAEGVGALQE